MSAINFHTSKIIVVESGKYKFEIGQKEKIY